jgi:serine/threonine protein kinase
MAEQPCPEDHELLPLVGGAAAVVDEHVAGCASCQKRLERLRAEVESLRIAFADTSLGDVTRSFTPPSPNGSLEPRKPQPPASIGKYRVIAELSRGGQGTVYRVVHPTLEKDFVLKLSHRSLEGDSPDRDYLVREGKVLAELEHPNLARVVDLDFHENRAFLVTEYVRGRTLHQHHQHHRPTPQEAARLIAQIARAVAVVHARGIIHLDLKPTNILIDEQGQPRVIDFGLALLRHAWVDEPGDPGTITGSVPYMAPEQARGEKEKLGVATDVFALGAVLYDLLAGHPPFQGADFKEALHRAQRCEFDRQALSDAGVPRPLEAICLKAMSAEPSDRHSSVEALAQELEAFCQPRQIQRQWLVAGAALLLVVGLGLLSHFWPWRNSEAPLQYLLRIEREVDGHPTVFAPEDFPKALPIREGDKFRLFGHVPASLRPAVFWFDSDGQLRDIDASQVDVIPSDGMVKIVWPNGARAMPFKPPTGTEFALVAAAADIDSLREEVGSAIRDIFRKQPLPTDIPDNVLVVLNPHRVVIRSNTGEDVPRGFGVAEENPLSLLEDRLEALRQRLKDRVPFFAAVAFPHVD